VTCVVSHDRYFLNRVCTDILAFEGDGKIHHSVGDYDYYLEKKAKAAAARGRDGALRRPLSGASPSSAGQHSGDGTKTPAKPKKLSFKETRELAGMEPQIHAVEAEIARIEGLFADPEFFRKHAAQVHQLTHDLEAAKEKLPLLYARWEALEALRLAAGG